MKGLTLSLVAFRLVSTPGRAADVTIVNSQRTKVRGIGSLFRTWRRRSGRITWLPWMTVRFALEKATGKVVKDLTPARLLAQCAAGKNFQPPGQRSACSVRPALRPLDRVGPRHRPDAHRNCHYRKQFIKVRRPEAPRAQLRPVAEPPGRPNLGDYRHIAR